MSAVSINKLTDLLPLVGALFNESAIVAEKMPHEKLVELVDGRILILVYLKGQLLGENERVCKARLNRGEAAQHDC